MENFSGKWGKLGSVPAVFNAPPHPGFRSKGRLFVGDRSNNRIQISTQDGKFIAEWKQFGRRGGIFIDQAESLWGLIGVPGSSGVMEL